MPRCNIYKNLWAWYDCYFIRMYTNGRMATFYKYVAERLKIKPKEDT